METTELLNSSQSDRAPIEQTSSKNSLGGITRKKVIVLVCLAINSLLLHICVSVMAPVFPLEVKKTHPHHSATSAFAIGMVFSVATISDFIAAPLLGQEVSNLGPKLMVVLGTFLVSGVTILFAFVPRIDDWATFLGFCYALRITKGFGAAMVFVASFSFLAGTFPNKVAFVSGLLEVFSGLGFVIGPAVGGVLYEKVDYMAPFLLVGCVLLAGTVVVTILLPTVPHAKEDNNGSFPATRVLRQPRALLMLAIAFWTSAALGFFDPTLGPFLQEKLGLSPSKVGACFLVGAGVYALLSPVIGYVADHHVSWPIVPAGLLVTAVGYLLMDINRVDNSQPHLWHVLVGYGIIGTGVGLASVPTSADVLHTMHQAGYPDSQALDGSVGGLLASSTSLGLAVGPALGGALVGALNFGDAGAIFGAVSFLLAILVVSHSMFRWCRSKCKKQAEAIVEAANKGHLISAVRTHFHIDAVRIAGWLGANVGQREH